MHVAGWRATPRQHACKGNTLPCLTAWKVHMSVCDCTYHTGSQPSGTSMTVCDVGRPFGNRAPVLMHCNVQCSDPCMTESTGGGGGGDREAGLSRTRFEGQCFRPALWSADCVYLESNAALGCRAGRRACVLKLGPFQEPVWCWRVLLKCYTERAPNAWQRRGTQKTRATVEVCTGAVEPQCVGVEILNHCIKPPKTGREIQWLSTSTPTKCAY